MLITAPKRDPRQYRSIFDAEWQLRRAQIAATEQLGELSKRPRRAGDEVAMLLEIHQTMAEDLIISVKMNAEAATDTQFSSPRRITAHSLRSR